MWFFSRKKEDNNKIAKMNHSLSVSFHRVKQDTQKIFQWLQYFQQKAAANEQQLQHHTSQIQELFRKFEFVPASREELKTLIDTYYSRYDSSSRIEELKAKIDKLISIQGPAMDQIQALRDRLEALETRQKPRAHFRERIVQKIQKSSKEYVKNLVLSYIRKYEKISALKLREMVVEEQGLASKSSFYRILEEIGQLDEVEMMQEGKQKFYFSTLHTSARN